MKEPFSLQRLLCQMTGHRLTLERGRYGKYTRICRCRRFR